MRRLVVLLVILVDIAVAGVLWHARSSHPKPRPAPDTAWSHLDPQARCDDAVQLVTHPDRWPTECRWRQPEDRLQGQSFPPPVGPPPYDRPHVEIYVAESQTREQLAHAIAHEYGHMHHTREFRLVSEWLAARRLPPDTGSEVWTEDYAEVFAALFSPPSDMWRAPTPRPSPEELAALKAEFFTP